MLSERLFEDVLVKYPGLIEDNLKFIGRQVTHFGKRIDILFEDRFNEKLIIELKKDNLDRNALSQVMEYEGFILSEKDPTTRVMLIANRIPLNLKIAMDHHGIEYKEITHKHLLEFLEKNDPQLLKVITEEQHYENNKPDPQSNNLTMAGKLDDILHMGGTWEDLISKVQIESNKMHFRMKYSKGVLNAHIRYRTVTQHNHNYLKDHIITQHGIFLRNQATDTLDNRIIGTVTKVKTKKSGNDRFEIWFNRSSEDSFPYGITSNAEGIKIKIEINEKIYTIGFHNTKSCVWLSARLERDGYNLTDLLKSNGIENREKLLLLPLGDDAYRLTRLNTSNGNTIHQNTWTSIKYSRRGRIIELIKLKKSDQEILDAIDAEFPSGVFSTSNKQALYGTKRDLGI
jgi:hypothetical protein